MTFHLKYEELLQRSEQGKYSYVVNIQSQGRKIEDFELNVDINESLPVEDLKILRAKDKDAAKFEAEDITRTSLKKYQFKTARIETSARYNDQDRKYFINYDVKRPNDGSDIQIGGGRFIHYFAPDNMPTVPKHIIFVIDVSGSMAGRKLQQTQDAVASMLSAISGANKDNFNMILFSSKVNPWKPSGKCYYFLVYQVKI